MSTCMQQLAHGRPLGYVGWMTVAVDSWFRSRWTQYITIFGSHAHVLHWTPNSLGAGPQMVNSYRAEPQTLMNPNLNPRTFLYWLNDLGKVTELPRVSVYSPLRWG